MSPALRAGFGMRHKRLNRKRSHDVFILASVAFSVNVYYLTTLWKVHNVLDTPGRLVLRCEEYDS